jgi:sulfur transfer protein SufE
MAGKHHLTIQLLRDIDSRTERGIVVHLATSTDRDTAAQLAAVSNAIVAALAATRIQLAAIRVGEL